MATAVALRLAVGCTSGRPVADPEVPLVSVDTAPWIVGQHGAVEESAPGSGLFLLQPGDFRARLPVEFRTSGLRVIFSGRPQPAPRGRPIVGQPFVLTAIRRERSAWESVVWMLRERLSAGAPPGDPYDR